MSYVPPLVIEAQSGVGMRLRINEISAKPLNWPSAVMRLQKDVWIAQIARRDALAVLDTASELIALSEEQGLPQTLAAALVYLGWALSQTKDVDQGANLVEKGLAAWNRTGLRSNLCFSLCLLAETYYRSGRAL